VLEALGKAVKTLDKGFAECRIRQRRLGKQCIDKAFFAEYFFSGTRQRKAAVTSDLQFKSEFSEEIQINELNLLAIANTVIFVPK
jgi:hypothetical protein